MKKVLLDTGRKQVQHMKSQNGLGRIKGVARTREITSFTLLLSGKAMTIRPLQNQDSSDPAFLSKCDEKKIPSGAKIEPYAW